MTEAQFVEAWYHYLTENDIDEDTFTDGYDYDEESQAYVTIVSDFFDSVIQENPWRPEMQFYTGGSYLAAFRVTAKDNGFETREYFDLAMPLSGNRDERRKAVQTLYTDVCTLMARSNHSWN